MFDYRDSITIKMTWTNVAKITNVTPDNNDVTWTNHRQLKNHENINTVWDNLLMSIYWWLYTYLHDRQQYFNTTPHQYKSLDSSRVLELISYMSGWQHFSSRMRGILPSILLVFRVLYTVELYVVLGYRWTTPFGILNVAAFHKSNLACCFNTSQWRTLIL